MNVVSIGNMLIVYFQKIYDLLLTLKKECAII